MRAARIDLTTQVRRYTATSRGALAASGVLVLVLVWLPAFAGESTVNRLTQFFSLLILAVGWNLLAGYGGMVSIGQQAFLGLSSYAVLYLSLHGVLAWWAVPLAISFAGVVSVPISFLAFRLRGSFFAIGTWVIADVCLLVVAQVETLGGGAGASLNDLNNFKPITVDDVTYWVGLAIAVATLVACALVLRSRLGLALISIRDDERAAEATGGQRGPHQTNRLRALGGDLRWRWGPADLGEPRGAAGLDVLGAVFSVHDLHGARRRHRHVRGPGGWGHFILRTPAVARRRWGVVPHHSGRGGGGGDALAAQRHLGHRGPE